MTNRKIFNRQLASGVAANIGADLRDLTRCGDHSSRQAAVTSVAIQLSGFKSSLADPQARDLLIQQVREEDDQDYEMPTNVSFDVPVEEKKIEGGQLFILNHRNDDQAVIFYLMGSAYLQRADRDHWRYLNRLALRTGCCIYTPLYPMVPVNHFNQIYHDMIQLYEDIYGITEASRITLMGDSAGGGLATGFCEYLGQRGLPQPGHLVLISPWLDLELKNPLIEEYQKEDVTLDAEGLRQVGRLWAGETNPADYRLSPINGDVSALRDVTIFVGTREIMYPDTNDFVEKLKQAHVPVDYQVGRGMFHIYPLYPIPESKDAMETVERLVHAKQDEA